MSTTELTVPERAAVALGAAEHEKNLIALSTKYRDIVVIANQAGREQCHSAYMELKNTRVAIEKAGKDARDDATKFSKAVIAEVERLTAITTAEEARLQALRDEWDAEREREKQAKAEAERQRVQRIRARIEAFMLDAVTVSSKSAAEIEAHTTRLSEMVISLEEFNEFAGEAQVKRDDTVKWLRERQQQAAEREAEARRLAEERAELDRQRREQAERERQAAEARALEERLAREAREREEARLRAEREAEEAERREAQRKADEAMRVEREAHEARMAAERAELARQQAEIAAAKAEQERREREAREAAEAEAKARAAAEKLEADHAEALAENARIDRERAELARARAEEAERIRRERVQFELNGPDAHEMLEILAAHYQVEQQTVLNWINRHVWAEVEVTA